MPGCRYVQEYLAIGEAPDQIRNCYQQRSRWCKVDTCLCSGLQLPDAAEKAALLASPGWCAVSSTSSKPALVRTLW